MAAKANIIRDLRAENYALKLEIDNLKNHIKRREAWFQRVKAKFKLAIQSKTTQSEFLVRSFQEELTWSELSSKPDLQLSRLVSFNKSMQHLLEEYED